jgi:histidine triad (HIT) family protein
MAEESCVLCQIIAGKVPSKKIYEDDDVLVILDINGAHIGHCYVMPKEHFPIMEQVPDELIGKLFTIANAVSSAIFETLKIEGTNIFVSNGVAAGQMVAHFFVNVIPRKQDDGINLQWEPKQLSEEEASSVETRLKEEIGRGGAPQEITPSAPKEAKKDQPAEITGEENYLIKQLRRIP